MGAPMTGNVYSSPGDRPVTVVMPEGMVAFLIMCVNAVPVTGVKNAAKVVDIDKVLREAVSGDAAPGRG